LPGFVDIDLQTAWYNLVLLAIAFLLALPVAMNREHQARSAGLRTFPLVAIAACGYMLVGTSVFSDAVAEARILEGLITGIGFIGGGAILKGKGSVSGTATAASIWNTGAIGVAVAYGRFEIAILLSAINFITLRFVGKFKSKPDRG
jgi:putative Mg2+ transporter-C (MgtC) family protein